MEIFLILAIPLLLAPSVLFFKSLKSFGKINAFGYLLVLFASIALLWKIFSGNQPVSLANFIYLDALSGFFVLVVSVISFAAALYSISYVKKDIEGGVISEKKARIYYLLFNLFCFSLLLVPVIGNLGLLWVAVEVTTLVSGLLVGFYNTKQSVEAAWKYIIICSVGIIFALLGTILFSYAFSLSSSVKSLNWADLLSIAGQLDKNLVKIAFIFVLAGYGTKAGLAPLHTWLPDAYGQAPAPVCALLSGGLSKVAIYAIIRFGMIVIKNGSFQFFSHLMLLFGMLSLAIACGFIIAQKDLKRLLAYSSIEHIGIISIGLGLGSSLGFLGALLHIFNDAVAKSLMFFGAGNITRIYKKSNMNGIRGVIKALPFTGIIVLLGVFALSGMPPFSLFFSELMIIIAAFTGGAYFLTILLLLITVAIFAAFISRFSEMLFGNLPKAITPEGEPLSGKLAFLFLFIPICVLGSVLIYFQKDLIWITQKLFLG